MSAMPPALLLRHLPELLRGFAADVPDLTITDLAIDSRQVISGGAFLACRGTQGHGLDYVDQALTRGAAVVLWEPVAGMEPPKAPVPLVAIEKLSEKAGLIASRFFGDPSLKLACIGVTGTDGKTSTAYLLAQALEQLGQPCFYLGTLGSGRWQALRPGDHTTPDPVNLQRILHRALADGCHSVSMEVSSHALHQSRVAGVQFHTAILTNVGRDHLDYHGILANYAEAKRRLFGFEGLQARVFNRDDDCGARWATEFDRATVYGIDGAVPADGNYLIARSPRLGADGLEFDVESRTDRGQVRSPLLGRFNVSNLLAALAALLETGVPMADACSALSAARTVPGRIEGFRGPAAAARVVVDYAHTPQALEQVLRAVRAHTDGKIWCVFGCGGDRDRGKRPLMGAAVARHADHAVVTDDNPRSESPAAIVDEILSGLSAGDRAAFQVIHDRATAIRTALAAATVGDTVVVAGKGHETTQTYGREARPFSDRDVVRRLVGKE